MPILCQYGVHYTKLDTYTYLRCVFRQHRSFAEVPL